MYVRMSAYTYATMDPHNHVTVRVIYIYIYIHIHICRWVHGAALTSSTAWRRESYLPCPRFVCVYVCVCVSVCVYPRFVWVSVYACVCVCLSVCVNVSTCMSVRLYICLYVCLYVCMSVCMCVCMFAYAANPSHPTRSPAVSNRDSTTRATGMCGSTYVDVCMHLCI